VQLERQIASFKSPRNECDYSTNALEESVSIVKMKKNMYEHQKGEMMGWRKARKRQGNDAISSAIL